MSALGWTLLHSLWQGAALGLLAWIALALSGSRSSRFRHGICVLAVTVLLATFAGTWLWLALSGDVPRLELLPSAPSEAQAPELRTVLPFLGSLPGQQGWTQTLAQQTGLLWSVGVAFMAIRLGRSWLQAHRLMRTHVTPAPAHWQATLDQLRRGMGLARPVALRLGSRVTSPMLWGFWRPVILIPMGALVHLEPFALEAVLVHELAHLRRLDPLTLLLQHLAETLLFYHPAVWWLSRQLRILREHCCDDVAVALLGDPLPYAEALARLETLRRHHPGGSPRGIPAVVHASQRGPLMNRIQRMLHPGPEAVPAFRGVALAMALATLGGGFLLARPTPTPSTIAPSVENGAILRLGERELQLAGFPEAIAFPMRSAAKNLNPWDRMMPWALEVMETRLKALQQGTPAPLPSTVNASNAKSIGMILAQKGVQAKDVTSLRIQEVAANSSETCLAFLFPKPLNGANAADRERAALEQAIGMLKTWHAKVGQVPPPPPPPPPAKRH